MPAPRAFLASPTRVVHRRAMTDTFYRKELPSALVAFGSGEGRTLLVEALAQGTAESFHALVAHLPPRPSTGRGSAPWSRRHPARIDPGRVWEGPWRFFGAEALVAQALRGAAAEGADTWPRSPRRVATALAVERFPALDGGGRRSRARGSLASVRSQGPRSSPTTIGPRSGRPAPATSRRSRRCTWPAIGSWSWMSPASSTRRTGSTSRPCGAPWQASMATPINHAATSCSTRTSGRRATPPRALLVEALPAHRAASASAARRQDGHAPQRRRGPSAAAGTSPSK